MNEILTLVNQYQNLTDMGKVWEGMRILEKISDKVDLLNGDIKTEGNCCTLRQAVSNLLFI